MADPFDPYLHWLGIRNSERPPNHYRLLGVALYESDPDVLVNAADRQMSHVRTFQTGKHSAQSQRLLNELAVAKLCLLNAEKKAAYDTQLRAEAARVAIMPPATPPAPSVEESVVGPPPIAPSSMFAEAPAAGPFSPAMPESPTPDATARADSSTALSVIMMLGLMTLLLSGLIFVLINVNKSKTKPASRATAASSVTRPEPKPKLSAQSQLKTKAELTLKGEPSSKPEPRPALRAKPPTHIEPGEPPAEFESVEPIRPKPRPEPAKPAEDRRAETPSADAQTAALKEIRELFKDRYAAAAAAGQHDQKRSLARMLMQQAIETRDDPAARFALYSEARDMAAAAGDSSLLSTIFDALGRDYRLDTQAMAAETLSKAAKKPRDAAGNHALARLALELARSAMAREDYDHAKLLADAGRDMARKARDVPTIKQITALLKDVEQRKELRAAFTGGAKLQAEKPDDPEAAQIAAQYYCLVKNDWPRGLRLLLKIADEPLRKAVEAELERAPSSLAETAALADRWHDAAGASEESYRLLARTRAVYWYQRALPDATGLTKKKVERRLTELSE